MIGRKLDSIDLDTIYYGFTHGAPATTVAEVIGCHPDTVRKSYKRLHDAEGGARQAGQARAVARRRPSRLHQAVSGRRGRHVHRPRVRHGQGERLLLGQEV